MTKDDLHHLKPLLNVVESILSNPRVEISQNQFEALKNANTRFQTYRLIVEYKNTERKLFESKNFEMYKQLKAKRIELETAIKDFL